MNKALWRYLRRDKRRVAGWLQRVDAEIFGAILELQEREGNKGSVVEIGVHEGKSFVPACMALRPDELALCIDVFDEQALNLDASGKGDLAAFQANLRRFGVSEDQVRVRRGSSADVTAAYILQQVGRVRFFSVDGGHWRDIVVNDLKLAEETLAHGGVIALDDYCRAAWPDVTYGYVVWQEQCQSIVPFAAGSNKLYLCHRDRAPMYRAALETPFLSMYRDTDNESELVSHDVYRMEPVEQDEQSLLSVARHVLRVFFPSFLVAIKKVSR